MRLSVATIRRAPRCLPGSAPHAYGKVDRRGGRKRRLLFAAGTGPANVEVAYRTVRLGGDGTCLAASYTPAAEVREAQFPLYPAEFRDWAARNAPQPPTAVCPPPTAPKTKDAAAPSGDCRILTASYGLSLIHISEPTRPY